MALPTYRRGIVATHHAASVSAMTRSPAPPSSTVTGSGQSHLLMHHAAEGTAPFKPYRNSSASQPNPTVGHTL